MCSYLLLHLIKYFNDTAGHFWIMIWASALLDIQSIVKNRFWKLPMKKTFFQNHRGSYAAHISYTGYLWRRWYCSSNQLPGRIAADVHSESLWCVGKEFSLFQYPCSADKVTAARLSKSRDSLVTWTDVTSDSCLVKAIDERKNKSVANKRTVSRSRRSSTQPIRPKAVE